MMQPSDTNNSADGQEPSAAPRKSATPQKALRVRTLVTTVVVLAVLAISGYFWWAYKVRAMSFALKQRAESLAADKDIPNALRYYGSYLEVRPDDAAARMRQAELYDEAAGNSLRTVELYQGALSAQGIAPEQELRARRRLTELLLQGDQLAAAETEEKKLEALEQKELAQKPKEWRWPGMKAMILARFRVEDRPRRVKAKEEDVEDRPQLVTAKDVDEAFAAVLDPPASGKPQYYRDPMVYLARYDYRRQQKLAGGIEDVAAAVKLAPTNPTVLLTAASAADAESRTAAAVGDRAKAMAAVTKVCDFCERAIAADPADLSGYEGLGRFYQSHGDLERAVGVWRRGLKAVKADSGRIALNLALSQALIEQGHLQDADTVMKDIDASLARIDAKARLAERRLVDLQTARLLFVRGKYDDAVHLLTDLAGRNDALPPGSAVTASQLTFEAQFLLGQSQEALKNWDAALAAFEQAAMLEPGDPRPRLAAAEVCRAVGRNDDAITNYQKALAIIEAIKPPPEAQRLPIYEALIALLDQQKRGVEADRYRTLYNARVADSAPLTLLTVAQALRYGKPDEALAVAQRGLQNRPADPLALIALGRAQQAKKADAAAADAYHQAFKAAKDPALKLQLAQNMLQGGDPHETAEAEKAARELLPQYAPAGLLLVGVLERQGKTDEALSLAQSDVKAHPKESAAHLALGAAWLGKKDNAKAETEFVEAARLAPDNSAPMFALLELYAATGRQKMAREKFEKMLADVKLSDADRELRRGDGLARLGDRKGAEQAFRKAVEASHNDPAVQVKLANFLIAGGAAGDEAEGEKLLRGMMREYDPARRRLAEVLISRGGEDEWEEAQKLLDQSAGDPDSVVDRFNAARALVRRNGADNLAKAADICTSLLAQRAPGTLGRQPGPGVSLLLAQIRERQNRLQDARKLYRALAEDHPTPARLAACAAFFVRHGPADEAEQLLKQLEKAAPDNLTTIELRAHWLRDQKRAAEIEPLVEAAAHKLLDRVGQDNPGQADQVVTAIGDLYARIQLYPAAERYYRQVLKSNPESFAPLALALAQQGRTGEAVTLCESGAKSDTSLRSALVLTAVLSTGRATPGELATAEPLLKKALEAHPDQPALLASVAGLRVIENRYADAVAMYRQILLVQPRNVEALNNLATVLSEQPEAGKPGEALECIEKAIALIGQQPLLLDTKGMALFYAGQLAPRGMPCARRSRRPIPIPAIASTWRSSVRGWGSSTRPAPPCSRPAPPTLSTTCSQRKTNSCWRNWKRNCEKQRSESSGQWTVVGGQTSDLCPLTTNYCPPSTNHCPPSTDHCPHETLLPHTRPRPSHSSDRCRRCPPGPHPLSLGTLGDYARRRRAATGSAQAVRRSRGRPLEA